MFFSFIFSSPLMKSCHDRGDYYDNYDLNSQYVYNNNFNHWYMEINIRVLAYIK